MTDFYRLESSPDTLVAMTSPVEILRLRYRELERKAAALAIDLAVLSTEIELRTPKIVIVNDDATM